MAVIVKYIVVRNGIEKMTFTSKKEADAYDKQLDVSENLIALLETSGIEIDEDKLEEISFFLAQHSDTVIPILKGVKPKPPAAEKPATTEKSAEGKTTAGTSKPARTKAKENAA